MTMTTRRKKSTSERDNNSVPSTSSNLCSERVQLPQFSLSQGGCCPFADCFAFFSCSKLRCLIYGCCLADFVLSFDSVHDITSHSFTISPLRISLSLHFAVRCRRFSFYFRYSFSLFLSHSGSIIVCI